jgi:hexose-6-phosphate dehydrogenase
LAPCRGRTAYYDAYGVLRDVMQNHMTEVLALFCAVIPGVTANEDHWLHLKRDAITHVSGARLACGAVRCSGV